MTLTWPSLREFLDVPAALTGRGVRLAIVDGTFASHPDVAGDAARDTYLVPAPAPDPRPVRLAAAPGPWTGSAQHGVWAAAAAAGSGALSGGRYAGVAPETELYLVAGWLRGVTPDSQARTEVALRWLRTHGKQYGIRGILPASQSGAYGTGLLPWQLDPIRILCEALVDDGFLVVAGTGNLGDLTCSVTQAQAPSVLAVGGVVLPPASDPRGTGAVAPYPGSHGTTFEGKRVPAVLAPADNLVLPWLGDESERARIYDGPEYGAVPDGYLRTGGTSFAGPAALGAAACVWQARPEWTAAQVRAALLATAVHRPAWHSLGAGLLSVGAALDADPGPACADAPSGGTPFGRYQRWRQAPHATRLQGIESPDDAEALDALLSFLPHAGAPPDGASGPVTALLRHPAAPLRAGALCVLAGWPGTLAHDTLATALADPDRRVRAAAVYAVARCPDAWPAVAPLIAGTCSDASLDVRAAALRLAGELGDARLVPPLVRGLAEDVRARRLANWAARRGALAALTGAEFPDDSPWGPGERPHSARRWAARTKAAATWSAWLASHEEAPDGT